MLWQVYCFFCPTLLHTFHLGTLKRTVTLLAGSDLISSLFLMPTKTPHRVRPEQDPPRRNDVMSCTPLEGKLGLHLPFGLLLHYPFADQKGTVLFVRTLDVPAEPVLKEPHDLDSDDRLASFEILMDS